MFTKAQRLELESLSKKLFGSSTYWQKIHKNQKVLDGFVEVKEKAYMRLPSRQIITTETAIKKGLIPAQKEIKGKEVGDPSTFEPQQLTKTVSKPIYRQANFDEMKRALLTALESKEFGEMPPVQLILTAATKFLKGELLNMPFLVVGESSQKDFDDLLISVPEDKRSVILQRKVPQGNPSLFCVDGIQFLSDVVFAHTQPDVAEKMLESYALGAERQADAVVASN